VGHSAFDIEERAAGQAKALRLIADPLETIHRAHHHVLAAYGGEADRGTCYATSACLVAALAEAAAERFCSHRRLLRP